MYLPLRVGSLPAREGVSGEPAMHHGHLGGEVWLLEVPEVGEQLVGSKQALQ